MLHTEHKNIPTVQQHSPLDAKSHIDELRFFRTRDRITSSFTLPPTLFDPKVIRFNGLGPIREEFRINGFEIEPIGISNSAEFCPNKRELNFNVGDIPSKAAFTVELVQTDKGLAFKVSKTYSNASPWFVQIPEEYFKSSEKQQDFLTNLREDLKAIYQSDVSSWQSFASQATPIKNDVNFP
ncbi:MAG: hypothetical protein NZT61_03350, partial [Deltaproteobacteria bacterium]|nr:hypothetical protein [Deltaproteobacteria bacterium]